MDEIVPVPSETDKPASKSRRILSARNLRKASVILDAGLTLLEGHKKTKTVGRALRLATTIGSAALPDDEAVLRGKLLETRQRMKDLEVQAPLSAQQRRQLQGLRDQVILVLDLYLEQA